MIVLAVSVEAKNVSDKTKRGGRPSVLYLVSTVFMLENIDQVWHIFSR